MQPGLTMVVISNMIISNIYHNFPEQRHSNIALNQLFEKIMALDIDERPLLRTVKKSWKRKRISADTVASITSCPSAWSFWNMFNDCSNPSVLPAMSRTRARVDTEEVQSHVALLLDTLRQCNPNGMTHLSLLLVEIVSPDVMFNGLIWPDEEFTKVNTSMELLNLDY